LVYNKGVPTRHDTVARFRERLTQLLDRSGMSQSAYAARVQIDRSTLSQLLAEKNERLPRADNLVSIALTEGVSIDWLLGLSEQGSVGADFFRPLEFERNASSPSDQRLARWHDEAAGYLIRYAPTSLPDLLKTDQVIEYEYRESIAFTPEQSIATAHEKLDYLRRPDTLMEVCMARQRLEGFARGEDVWRGLGVQARRAQLRHMIERAEELYPALRWFLYDARQRYSVPVILFGPRRAVLYIGQMYLVFNSTEHVRVFTQHFDDLVKAAVVQPTDIVPLLRKLLAAIE
jgi:transcriptional regulator with XRE-family HTH domain